MRCDGKSEPSIGAGTVGQFASIVRPYATAEAYAIESCFERPEMRRGRTVSTESAGVPTDGIGLVFPDPSVGLLVEGNADLPRRAALVSALTAGVTLPAGVASPVAVHAAAAPRPMSRIASARSRSVMIC